MTIRFDPYCCCCVPKEIAKHSIYGDGEWDLTEYQGDNIVPNGQFWRLRNNYMGYVPMRQGCIDANGKLVDLPDAISSDSYKYVWNFVLESGCPTKDGKILWPNNEKTAIFNCQR